MRIGVDASCWSNKRGFGRFTRELLNALIRLDQRNDYWFFVDKDSASECDFPQRANIVVAPTTVSPTVAASASGRRSFRDLWVMSRQVMRHDLDLFFFPAVYSYFPIFNRIKIVMTIHDMTPDRHPDKVFPNKRLNHFWKLKQYLAIWQSNLIITVSEYSKKDILNTCKVPESLVRVIPEGPSPSFKPLPRDSQMIRVLDRYQLDPQERFLLYVGGISPHKNLGGLIETYYQLMMDPQFSDVKLVIVGDFSTDSFYSDYQNLKQQIDHRCLQEKAIFTGFVDDNDLAYIYNAASLLVFPSLCEGFGLPAVEAMACGTPVAASNAGSLPEIVGSAGCFFDPYRPDEMLSVIKGILTNAALREKMSHRGLTRAKQFSWDKASSHIISIFNELLE